MDPDDPLRIDLLVRLGTASINAGDLERARGRRSRRAVKRAARSMIGGWRSEHAWRSLALLWQMEPEGVTEQLEREAEAAIPVLEELGDDEGLARAWSSLCEVGLMWCHASEIETASERAAFHAERAGDRAALSYAPSGGSSRRGSGWRAREGDPAV